MRASRARRSAACRIAVSTKLVCLLRAQSQPTIGSRTRRSRTPYRRTARRHPDVGEVRHDQPARRGRPELPLHQIRCPIRGRISDRSADLLGALHPLRAVDRISHSTVHLATWMPFRFRWAHILTSRTGTQEPSGRAHRVAQASQHPGHGQVGQDPFDGARDTPGSKTFSGRSGIRAQTARDRSERLAAFKISTVRSSSALRRFRSPQSWSPRTGQRRPGPDAATSAASQRSSPTRPEIVVIASHSDE
jgi:hypothetical protein